MKKQSNVTGKRIRDKTINARDFDKLFNEGGDIMPYLDVSRTRLLQPLVRRVNVDFPERVVTALDNAAARRGVARQALIKDWLVERLDAESERLVKSKKPA
jgi:hypothetical protein